MDNPVYQKALEKMRKLFGSPQPLASGTGARCVNGKKGKVTLYHQEIAPGNQAELALEIESIARRKGIPSNEARKFILELRALTGREISPNRQYDWPRIGFQTVDNVEAVAAELEKWLTEK